MLLNVLLELVLKFDDFLPKVVDYGKSYLWSWGVDVINYASKYAYMSIFSAYIKTSIEYPIRVIMKSPCAF